jgi:hypothetical protein
MWIYYALIVGLLLALLWLTRVHEAFIAGLEPFAQSGNRTGLTQAYGFAALEPFMVKPGTTLPGGFQVPAVNLGDIPEPHTLFAKARELLDRYDRPDVWLHAAQVMDKDPGQLARMNLGIVNTGTN